MKLRIIGGLLLILMVIGGYFFMTGDFKNKMSRKSVEFMAGDYAVTTSLYGGHTKTWQVKSGKITTVPEKGYYLFWAKTEQGNQYVQVPIGCTMIEEIN